MSAWAEQWDSPLRWSVRSQSSNKLYLVDLGNWECQCTRHSCHEQHRKVAQGGSRLVWDHQCFHKVTALRAFIDEVLKPSIKDTPILCHFLKPEFAGHMDALALAMIDHLYEEEIQNAKSDSDREAQLSRPNPSRKRSKWLPWW